MRQTSISPAVALLVIVSLIGWSPGVCIAQLVATATNLPSATPGSNYSATASSSFGSAGGVTTVVDSLSFTGAGCSDPFPVPVKRFSWYSLQDVPGQPHTYFPKIYSGQNNGANTWQTIGTVEIVPGVVVAQEACFNFSGLIGPVGGVGLFNALAYAADLNPNPLTTTEITSPMSLEASASFGNGALSGVRLRSSVEPYGDGFRYTYLFENSTDSPVNISWNAAGLTQDLLPFEVITVEYESLFGARESQGYANISAATPIADIIAMALVPVPEPTTLALVAIGFAVVSRRIRLARPAA